MHTFSKALWFTAILVIIIGAGIAISKSAKQERFITPSSVLQGPPTFSTSTKCTPADSATRCPANSQPEYASDTCKFIVACVFPLTQNPHKPVFIQQGNSITILENGLSFILPLSWTATSTITYPGSVTEPGNIRIPERYKIRLFDASRKEVAATCPNAIGYEGNYGLLDHLSRTFSHSGSIYKVSYEEYAEYKGAFQNSALDPNRLDWIFIDLSTVPTTTNICLFVDGNAFAPEQIQGLQEIYSSVH